MKNKAIEFYRFLFSLIICVFHLSRNFPGSQVPFSNGDLSVEFFLILSGLFLAKNISKKDSENLEMALRDNLQYTKNRFFRLYPTYLFTIVYYATFRIFVLKNLTFEKWISTGLGEILMLQTLTGEKLLTSVFWFPSALLIASFVVSFFIRLNKKLCIEFLFPVASIGIISALLNQNHTITSVNTYSFLFSDAVWRAIAELMIGCICFSIIEILKQKLGERRYPISFSVIELALLSVLLYLLYTPSFLQKNYIVLLLFAIFIIIVMSQTSYLSHLLNNKICDFLGKISYGIYLNQIVLFSIAFRYYKFTDNRSFWITTAACLAANIVLSIFTTYLITNWMPKLFSKISKLWQHRMYSKKPLTVVSNPQLRAF